MTIARWPSASGAKNCSLWASFPFPTVFLKDLCCRHIKTRPCAYKSFFILNSAEHEISKLDNPNLINLWKKLLTCADFHGFCLSNQSFKFNIPYFNIPYSLKDKLGVKVSAQTQLSMDLSFISMGPGLVWERVKELNQYYSLKGLKPVRVAISEPALISPAYPESVKPDKLLSTLVCRCGPEKSSLSVRPGKHTES